MHQAYRKMEKKKRFYHIEVEGLMRRQQACLDNLTSDNSALQEIVDTYEIKVHIISIEQGVTKTVFKQTIKSPQFLNYCHSTFLNSQIYAYSIFTMFPNYCSTLPKSSFLVGYKVKIHLF